MNIFNEVVKGASRQFGREFGRAGANEILKGKNAYYIKSESDYSGRIKPSDNELVRAIKEVAKVKFVTSNKANVSRLVEMTNILLPVIAFKGDETLDQLNDILKLTGGYNDKVEYGLTLIDDNYQDKSLDYFNSKRTELEDKFEKLNVNMKEHILHNLNIAKNSKKSKEKAAGLSLFFGTLGVQWRFSRQSAAFFGNDRSDKPYF